MAIENPLQDTRWSLQGRGPEARGLPTHPAHELEQHVAQEVARLLRVQGPLVVDRLLVEVGLLLVDRHRHCQPCAPHPGAG